MQQRVLHRGARRAEIGQSRAPVIGGWQGTAAPCVQNPCSPQHTCVLLHVCCRQEPPTPASHAPRQPHAGPSKPIQRRAWPRMGLEESHDTYACMRTWYSSRALKSILDMATTPGCSTSSSWHATAPLHVSSTCSTHVHVHVRAQQCMHFHTFASCRVLLCFHTHNLHAACHTSAPHHHHHAHLVEAKAERVIDPPQYFRLAQEVVRVCRWGGTGSKHA